MTGDLRVPTTHKVTAAEAQQACHEAHRAWRRVRELRAELVRAEERERALTEHAFAMVEAAR